MRDAEFEKNVRKSMDELKFSPSDSVWKNVELEINEKKKRRYPLIWFFLASGLMLIGYFVINHSGDRKVNNQPSAQQAFTKSGEARGQENPRSAEVNPESNESNSNLSTTKHANTLKSVNSSGLPGSPKANQPKWSNGLLTPVSSIKGSRHASKMTNKEDKTIDSKSGITSKNKSGSTLPAKFQQTAESGNKDITSGNGKLNSIVSSVGSNHGSVDSLTGSNSGSESIKQEQALISNKFTLEKRDSSLSKVKLPADINKENNIAQDQKKSLVLSKTGRWKYGFQVSPALSTFQRSLLHTTTANAAIPAAASIGYYSTIQVNGRSVGPTYYGGVQSTIKPGFAFSAGGFVQRVLTNRISVSAGLNYYFVTTHIETGGKVNSSLNLSLNNTVFASASAYYLSGNSQNYTNHFHFLELPVNVRLQLNRSIVLPVYWEAGISVSRLLATDALQYSDLSGVYYKSDNFYNKTQFNGQTALMLGFYEKKTLFAIGPMVQYGISNLTRSGSGGSPQHAFISGLKITITPGFR